jgi:CubicO group peptidase (beta-lactamase class C family)
MRTKSLIFSLLIFFTLPLWAQVSSLNLIDGRADMAGMSADRLQLINRYIQEGVDKQIIPGGVFLIARKGVVVLHKSFGYSDLSQKKSFKNDNLFRIASMTKAITSVAIMQLYEQGKLGLDDPVYQFIPAFKNTKVLDQFNDKDSSYTTVAAKSPITIRHLLTHTSGIVYGPFSSGAIRAVYAKNRMMDVGLWNPENNLEQSIDLLAAVPLAFQPGEKYNYGLNMDVLGRIIEVVSGLSLSDYFRINLFEPLNMKNTSFFLSKEKQSKLVPVYGYDENGAFVKVNKVNISTNLDYPLQVDNQYYSGGGGLISEAMDYAIFLQTLLNGGDYNGKRILGRKAIEVMTSDQMIALNKEGKGFSKQPGVTYCLGFSLLTDDGKGISSKSPGTYEWGGAFNSKFFIDPKENLIFVGMTQVTGFKHPEFWTRLYALIYGAIDE